MGNRPKSLIVLAALLAAALGLAGCGSSSSGSGGAAEENGDFRVVVIAALSGVAAANCVPGAAGVRTAVDSINKAGGVDGHKLKLDVIDTQSNPDVAVAAAQKIAADPPLAVFGFVSGAEGSKVTPVFRSARITFFSAALPDEILYPAQPGFFMPSTSAKQNAVALAKFLAEREDGGLAQAKIDIAAINSPYVDTVIKELEKLLAKEGAKISKTERYDYGIASFAAQAGSIARDNPTSVLILGTPNDTIAVSKGLTDSGVKVDQIGFSANAGSDVLTQLKNPNYFVPTENVYASQNTGFLAAAAAAGVQKDVESSTYSLVGWVAAHLVAKGLEQCGDGCDTQKLSTALEGISDYVVPGDVSYGPVGFSKDNHVSPTVVKFHNYDPATSKIVDSGPIDISSE